MLCHLSGKTHEEASRLLQWPVGTVSGRLSRGRRLLKARLERRGFAAPSAIVLVPWLVLPQPLSLPAIESALDAAMHYPFLKSGSVSVLSLTRGVLKAMILNRIKAISIAVVCDGRGLGRGLGAHAAAFARARLASQRQSLPRPQTKRRPPPRQPEWRKIHPQRSHRPIVRLPVTETDRPTARLPWRPTQ